MTSNLGSDLIQEHYAEKDYEEMKALLMELLTRSFRPEFINRIDETVVFHPLDEDHIKSIARIQLKSLMGRLESQGFEVEVSEELLTKLVHAGFDPVYGARPLKRAIQQKVENPLAQALLSGRVIPGKKLLLGAQRGTDHQKCQNQQKPPGAVNRIELERQKQLRPERAKLIDVVDQWLMLFEHRTNDRCNADHRQQ